MHGNRLDALLPLTLTLSRGEREQQAAAFRASEDHPANTVVSFSVRLGAILLLPAGEGRGEGEDNASDIFAREQRRGFADFLAGLQFSPGRFREFVRRFFQAQLRMNFRCRVR